MAFKVAGPEKITVKAGTFDAVKVVGKGRWFNHQNQWLRHD